MNRLKDNLTCHCDKCDGYYVEVEQQEESDGTD